MTKEDKVCGYCLKHYGNAWDKHLPVCPKAPQVNREPLPFWNSDQRTAEPALRYDGGKSRVDLIDPGFILRLGDHYRVGAEKYAERNWQKGMSFSRCYVSAQRHMLAFWSGEDIDAETGSRHVIAAAWNMAAIDFYMSNPELSEKFDDRPKKPLTNCPGGM